MRIIGEVQGPVLLVDDVATSGQHIEEAAHLLREAGANVLAVAWIGGDVVKD
jgi:orotate phosphoribosyltransferase